MNQTATGIFIVMPVARCLCFCLALFFSIAAYANGQGVVPASVIRPDEIRLHGRVVRVEAAELRLTLEVEKFSLPSGKSAALPARKSKLILLDAPVTVLLDGKPLALADVKEGQSAFALGKDVGDSFIARALVVFQPGTTDSSPSTSNASPGTSPASDYVGGDESDFSEASLTGWAAFSSDATRATIAPETARRVAGAKAIRFETASGADTGVRFPADSLAHWDLRGGRKHFTFWAFAQNERPFQGHQPILVLKCRGGNFTYTPQRVAMFPGKWRQYWIPLEGNAQWVRTREGAPEISDVHAFEIHHDTFDYGFSVCYDGLTFTDKPEIQDGPRQVDPFVIEPKVLLIVVDPILKSNGERVHERYKWSNPFDLVPEVMGDLFRSSHGRVRYHVVETIILDEFPNALDGSRYTERTYNRNFSRKGKNFDIVDLKKILRENGVVPRVESGEVDEVWMYTPPLGTPESIMVGAKQAAYWINSPPLDVETKRPFVIMVLNFERGVSEALHSFGHRTESIMSEMYGGWKPQGGGTSTWDKFTALDKNSPGEAGVGNIHFPPNAKVDYEYAPPGAVLSNADDWYSYPNLKGHKRPIGALDWGLGSADVTPGAGKYENRTNATERRYLNWWYHHIPHFSGRAPDGRLNNWWRYIADPAEFRSERAHIAQPRNRYSEVPAVVLSSHVNGDEIAIEDAEDNETAPVVLHAEAATDAPLARVDFFVDGQMIGSDSLAPYSAIWSTEAWPRGEHKLHARAFGLSGFEVTSDPIAVRLK